MFGASAALIIAMLSPAPTSASEACAFDREQMLALDQRAFDQDLQGGWRAIAARDGCALAAADLIRDYRQMHGSEDGILYWHEGQLRASAGQIEAAVALFERSRRSDEDIFGWNPYVDATIAFLRRDRPALLAARNRLARLPRPEEFAPRDPEGHPLQISWPMNLNVVDGLIACFGKSYAEAYGSSCTRPLRAVRGD